MNKYQNEIDDNLTSKFLQHVSNEQGLSSSSSSSSYVNNARHNDHEDEAIDDEMAAPNKVNDSKYHSNMSDITNTQMQLDHWTIQVF